MQAGFFTTKQGKGHDKFASLSRASWELESLFIPDGGTQGDLSIRFLWPGRPSWSVEAFVQHERWFVRVLHPAAQQNVAGSLQLTFAPHLRRTRSGW